MSYAALKQLVYIVGVVMLLTLVADKLIAFGAGPTVFGSGLSGVAGWVTIGPMFIAMFYALVQGFPGGRRIVPLPGTTGQDTWLLILIGALATPSAAAVAQAPALAAVTQEEKVPVTLVVIALAVMARVFQLRAAEKSGAVLPHATMIH